MADTGRLTGPELTTAGISYRAGDKVVALAPERNAGLVTSQRATISHVDVDTTTVMLRTTDGHQVALTAGQLGADRLGHAYATTVHRFQGATVERAHLYADGGGRELAYVAMSRARHTSTAYVVADDLAQAAEDLTRDWATRHVPTWALDTGLPSPQQVSSDPGSISESDRVGIVAVRPAHDRLLADSARPGRPPAPPEQADAARVALHRAQHHLADLASLTGVYTAGPIVDAARNAYEAGSRLGELEHAATTGGWIERRHGRRHLPDATSTAADTEDRLAGLIDAERSRLNDEIGHLQARLDILDQHSPTGLERWQQAAGQHAVAARGERRLGRVVETARRRLEQTDRRDRPTRRQLNRPPTPAQVVEPEPPTATHEAPGL